MCCLETPITSISSSVSTKHGFVGLLGCWCKVLLGCWVVDARFYWVVGLLMQGFVGFLKHSANVEQVQDKNWQRGRCISILRRYSTSYTPIHAQHSHQIVQGVTDVNTNACSKIYAILWDQRVTFVYNNYNDVRVRWLFWWKKMFPL